MMNMPPPGGRPNDQQIDGDKHDVVIFSDEVGAFCLCGEMYEAGTIASIVGTGTTLLVGECPKGHRIGRFMAPMGFHRN
jgi:hypothetical protein